MGLQGKNTRPPLVPFGENDDRVEEVKGTVRLKRMLIRLINPGDFLLKILKEIRGLIHWTKTKKASGRDDIANKILRV